MEEDVEIMVSPWSEHFAGFSGLVWFFLPLATQKTKILSFFYEYRTYNTSK